MPDNIREGLEGIPVLWYQDVYKVAFLNQGLNEAEAEMRWEPEIRAAEERERELSRGPPSTVMPPVGSVTPTGHQQDEGIRAKLREWSTQESTFIPEPQAIELRG